MLFRNMKSPRTAVPVGMCLVSMGLLLNTTWFAVMRSVRASAHLTANAIDFWHGFFIGLGIMMEIAGLIVMLQAKRRGGDASPPPQG